MSKKIVSLFLCVAMLVGAMACFAGCGKKDGDTDGNTGSKQDALVIMTEQLDGLFNPFYSTSATDATIVGMTQISMLTAKYVNGSIEVGYGEDEAVAVKDFMQNYDQAKDQTVYTFVLKNGILYSDGHPLTMEDVLFNLYVYLDPVYTGSSTMYSTKIQGLTSYRNQENSSNDSNADDMISERADTMASARIKELINLFQQHKTSSGYYADYETMKNAINAHSLSSGYKSAISNDPSEVTNANLLADYENTLKKFKEELGTDYLSAQDSYTEEPYKSREEFQNPIVCFMYTEGYVTVEWEKDENGRDDKSRIKNVKLGYNANAITTQEQAIEHVYNDKISSQLDQILTYWATAQELKTEYSAKAKEVLLHANITEGQLKIDHISGIVSLGHNSATKGTTVTVNGTDYKVASAHNADGTVANDGEYDVLQITIDGVDPKAVWNFAFSVAPQHYYGKGSAVGVDIENNKFGVEFGSFSFMTDIIQSATNIKVPMGAGAYKATNRDNADNPSGSDFYKDNVVYFKANNNFATVGSGLNNAKIEKVRYQIVSASNAVSALNSGEVHYITPQLTTQNYDQLESMKANGFNYLQTQQLGYGYIGINAAKVPDVNIRKAILSAMNTTLALDYYRPGTAEQIYWPMSTVSWAYPKGDDGNVSKDNGKNYPQLNGRFDRDLAKEYILQYMNAAGVSAGDSKLKITLTIAGSNLQDHPTYKTFRDAAQLLNECGWDVDVKPDTQALTKLNTGSLQVWAAAWGSALDPDMYQVYHKNSTATSTLAWGYPSIKTSGSDEEKATLNRLSDLIDQARETNDQAKRTELYEKAMKEVLELAIELPVYQRSVIYAYNANVLKTESMPSADELNPYSSPLDRIWELEFAE